MSDTTNFQLTEDQKGRMTDDEKGKDRQFDFGLLANFVHQVINPLSGTSGHIGNLIDGLVPENKRDQRLRAARAQLEHSISLMRNLAYFSQISIDPKNTNPGAVRKTCVIPQVIIEAIQYYQEMAANMGIAVEHLNASDQYKVIGNPDLLRQVFMNMIDNGIKYADRGSRVTFSARAQKSTKALIVEITSHGAPIAISERSKLFDLGFRGAAAMNKVASGTGLGLNICRTIIRGVHGGDITVDSSADGKTTFMIRFPEYVKGERRGEP